MSIRIDLFHIARLIMLSIVMALPLLAKPALAASAVPYQMLAESPEGVPSTAARWQAGWVRADAGERERWVRLEIATSPQMRLLTLGVPDIEALTLYQGEGPAARPLLQLQPDSPYAARPWPSRLLALPISPSTQPQVYLLRYRVHADTPLSLQLVTPTEYAEQLARSNLFTGLVIGALLALLLLAVLHYHIEQQPAYLYYAMTVGLAIVFLLQIGGFLFPWLWPNAGLWNQGFPMWLQAAIHCSHAAFTINLFDLRRRAPRLWQAYLLVMAAALLSATVYQFTGSLALLMPTALLHLPLPLLAGWLAWRQRLPAAGWYLAGTTCLLLFVNVLFGLSIMGVLHGLPFFVFPPLGYLLEALCFAAALGWRMHSLQRSHARQLEARLLEAEQLAQAEADKLALQQRQQQQQLELAAAGHDLSQPLAAIRLAIPALQAQAGTAGIGQHIAEALRYTEDLLQELLQDARQQHAAGHTGQLALDEVLIAAYQRHLPTAAAKGLRLRYVATRLRYPASATVLNRLLDNLLVNALRYTEQGGVVFGLRRQADQLLLQVWDSGPGIHPTDQARLLQPFTQSGRRSAEHQGYGLGLYIVQTLCAQSGYRLQLASGPLGSVFSIVLPLPPAQNC
ncbi:7TM diverse intracellular signaling domain-containing protein [Chitinibacter tainanensis]|uniref:sensor histidine kinase n=1 Tax=Chitinibacter tainanensis TaxID=230667 RepID=UPI002355A55C|nr:7TM diverse intracellular signaling domain-containing protein [Chitinibacter tainanensis]